ncbi:MAG: cysteine hydrolase, partial [Pseudomonadota bacterium]|nr:cysteine hydrolase [Pseudomonadota bacterium]
SWGPRNNPDAEANIARLLEFWRETGRPVFHVAHDSASPDSPLRPGAPGNALKPEAEPREGEPVYRKAVNSAFIGTTLEGDLRRAGLGALVVVGLTTNHCVSTTVRMAGNLGFDTYLVSDATATFDRAGLDGRIRPADEVHAAALSDLQGEFAKVIDTAALLARSPSRAA